MLLFVLCREALEAFSDRDCFGSSGRIAGQQRYRKMRAANLRVDRTKITLRRETGDAVCGLRAGVFVRVLSAGNEQSNARCGSAIALLLMLLLVGRTGVKAGELRRASE